MIFSNYKNLFFWIVKNNDNEYDFSIKKHNLLFIASRTHNNNNFLIYLKQILLFSIILWKNYGDNHDFFLIITIWFLHCEI